MVPDLRFYVFMTAVILPVYHAEATPNASITPAPQFPPSLFARQDSGDIGPNVYGYINGDINSPLGCGAGYQFDKSDSIGGCCNEATCTSLYFTCVNKGDPDPCGGESSYLCALGAAAITALSCNAANPSCYEYMVMSSPQDTNPAYLPRCGMASSVIEVFMTATNGADTSATTENASFNGISTAIKTSTSRSKSSGNTNGESAASTGGAAKSPAEETTTPSNGNDNSSNSNKTTIIIAVIVGIVVIATVIGGIIFLLRRQKAVQEKIHNPDIPDGVSVIPTNYQASEAGLEKLSRMGRAPGVYEWDDGISTLGSGSERGARGATPLLAGNMGAGDGMFRDGQRRG